MTNSFWGFVDGELHEETLEDDVDDGDKRDVY